MSVVWISFDALEMRANRLCNRHFWATVLRLPSFRPCPSFLELVYHDLACRLFSCIRLLFLINCVSDQWCHGGTTYCSTPSKPSSHRNADSRGNLVGLIVGEERERSPKFQGAHNKVLWDKGARQIRSMIMFRYTLVLSTMTKGRMSCI